mmetsp:Transcript_18388/g.42589  ORF Transcript_18388/g.42589 Transcript_18388/m.42589 type:complete len:226 (+) Transcript_18388:95-772(+)
MMCCSTTGGKAGNQQGQPEYSSINRHFITRPSSAMSEVLQMQKSQKAGSCPRDQECAWIWLEGEGHDTSSHQSGKDHSRTTCACLVMGNSMRIEPDCIPHQSGSSRLPPRNCCCRENQGMHRSHLYRPGSTCADESAFQTRSVWSRRGSYCFQDQVPPDQSGNPFRWGWSQSVGCLISIYCTVGHFGQSLAGLSRRNDFHSDSWSSIRREPQRIRGGEYRQSRCA